MSTASPETPETPRRRKSDRPLLRRAARWFRARARLLSAASAALAMLAALWDIGAGVASGLARLEAISTKLDGVSRELSQRAIWMGASNATHAAQDRRIDRLESAQADTAARVIRAEFRLEEQGRRVEALVDPPTRIRAERDP